MFLEGEKDTVVPKQQSLAVRSKARGHVDYREYAGEGHMLSSPSTMADLFPRVDAFIRTHTSASS